MALNLKTMKLNSLQPHIQLSPNKKYERVLVCGAPERAEEIASYLTNAILIAKNREYFSYSGEYQGQDVLVTSHGVGSAGAMICFQELINVGAKVIIRLGTAGGLYDETKVGDIVVPNNAIRKDGVTALMVPKSYPAIPDLELASKLYSKLQLLNAPVQMGTILTSDLFYPGLLDPGWKSAKDDGAIAVEMECSALFVLGALRNIKTASVLVLDGNPLKWEEGCYEPNANQMKVSLGASMQVCLSALVELGV